MDFPGKEHEHGNPTVLTGPTETTGAAIALKHNPGISNGVDWTADEQTILEEGLEVYSSEPILFRYAKIAANLRKKTTRDVALRCRWMMITAEMNGSKQPAKKRRSEELSVVVTNTNDHDKKSSKKNNSTIGLIPDTADDSYSSLYMEAARFLVDGEDDVSGFSFKDIGGVVGDLLEKNHEILNQIEDNIGRYEDASELLAKSSEYIDAIRINMPFVLPQNLI